MKEARDVAHEIWCSYCLEEHCHGCDRTTLACRATQVETLQWAKEQVLNHPESSAELLQTQIAKIEAEQIADAEATAKRLQVDPPDRGTA
jgi:hypothetical protein